MMQRNLTGLQRHHDILREIHFVVDGLASGEKIARREGIFVRLLTDPVAAWQNFNTAHVRCGVRSARSRR